MAERDEFDEAAKRLLPCSYVTRFCQEEYEDLCYGCRHRPAVAAALREAAMREAELRREVDRLKSQLISFHDVNGFPEHFQGPPSHELMDLLTAEDCNAMVAKIKELRERLAGVC